MLGIPGRLFIQIKWKTPEVEDAFLHLCQGDNMAKVWPLTSTTLMLIVFIAPSSSSALGRAVWRPG